MSCGALQIILRYFSSSLSLFFAGWSGPRGKIRQSWLLSSLPFAAVIVVE